jgi:hypothetical protein
MIRFLMSAVLAMAMVLPPIWGQVGAKEVPVTPAIAEPTPTQFVSPCQTFLDGTSAMAKIPSYGTFIMAEPPSYVEAPLEQLKEMVPELSRGNFDAAPDAEAAGTAALSQNNTGFRY